MNTLILVFGLLFTLLVSVGLPAVIIHVVFLVPFVKALAGVIVARLLLTGNK